MNKMMIVLVAIGCLLILSEAKPQKGTYLGSGSGSYVTGFGNSKTGKDGSETSAGSSGINGAGGYVSIVSDDSSAEEPTETPTEEPTEEPTNAPTAEPPVEPSE